MMDMRQKTFMIWTEILQIGGGNMSAYIGPKGWKEWAKICQKRRQSFNNLDEFPVIDRCWCRSLGKIEIKDGLGVYILVFTEDGVEKYERD